MPWGSCCNFVNFGLISFFLKKIWSIKLYNVILCYDLKRQESLPGFRVNIHSITTSEWIGKLFIFISNSETSFLPNGGPQINLRIYCHSWPGGLQREGSTQILSFRSFITSSGVVFYFRVTSAENDPTNPNIPIIYIMYRKI